MKCEREEFELDMLSPYAAKSGEAKYDKRPKLCGLRSAYCRDRDQIMSSKAFRRLMHKTQVFISPEGDHFRTRLMHTLEAAQVARAITRALKLNEDLAEAIALGHDLGHTPFGHTGESALNDLMEPWGGFRHNEQSVRVVTALENGGAGLGLTHGAVDGILNHRTGMNPATLEGQAAQIADKIAYVNHDIDDAERAGVLNTRDLPPSAVKRLGQTPAERIDNLIRSAIKASANQPYVKLEPDAEEALLELRGFMFRTVYQSQIQAEERQKIKGIIAALFRMYIDCPHMLPEPQRSGGERAVCDFIAGMTDRYAMRVYFENFVPETWKIRGV